MDNLHKCCVDALKRLVGVFLFCIRECEVKYLIYTYFKTIPFETTVFFPSELAYPVCCVPCTSIKDPLIHHFKTLFGFSGFTNPISPFKAFDNTAISFADLIQQSTSKLKHQQIDKTTWIVVGDYAYFHYGSQGVDDKGWGCAYRSFQTIYSWFIFQGYAPKATVPSIREIQQCLIDLGDKSESIMGSSNWIGSIEIGMVLAKLLGIEYRILTISSGISIETHARQFLDHFKRYSCPIMIGGASLAHTILGVSLDENTGECYFLVADPHYYGQNILRNVVSKGYVGWKSPAFWKSSNAYNIVFPILANM